MAKAKVQPKTKGESSGQRDTPADTLSETTKKSDVELKDKELDKISGGCTGKHYT